MLYRTLFSLCIPSYFLSQFSFQIMSSHLLENSLSCLFFYSVFPGSYISLVPALIISTLGLFVFLTLIPLRLSHIRISLAPALAHAPVATTTCLLMISPNSCSHTQSCPVIYLLHFTLLPLSTPLCYLIYGLPYTPVTKKVWNNLLLTTVHVKLFNYIFGGGIK